MCNKLLVGRKQRIVLQSNFQLIFNLLLFLFQLQNSFQKFLKYKYFLISYFTIAVFVLQKMHSNFFYAISPAKILLLTIVLITLNDSKCMNLDCHFITSNNIQKDLGAQQENSYVYYDGMNVTAIVLKIKLVGKILNCLIQSFFQYLIFKKEKLLPYYS